MRVFSYISCYSIIFRLYFMFLALSSFSYVLLSVIFSVLCIFWCWSWDWLSNSSVYYLSNPDMSLFYNISWIAAESMVSAKNVSPLFSWRKFWSSSYLRCKRCCSFLQYTRKADLVSWRISLLTISGSLYSKSSFAFMSMELCLFFLPGALGEAWYFIASLL